MRKKSILTIAILSFLMVALIAGCSPAATDAPVVDEPKEVEETAEDISLYFLLKTLSNPHWVAMKDGIEAAAADAGVEVFVDAMNSEDELSGQLDKLLTAAGQGYDGIGIAPISPTNAIEGIVAANANGIPVVNLDEKVDGDELAAAGGYVIGFGTTDNVAVGATGAGYIIENAEPGEVAIIEGKAGNFNGENRKKGAEDALTEAGFTVVVSQPADWDRNKALDVATNILSQYPDLKAFYCANDTMALGVQEAVENAGLADKVLVVGTDGIPDAIKSVSEGRMAATVAQDPAEIGVVCFNMLLDAVKAGNAGALDKEPAFQYVDSVLITVDNAADFLEGGEEEAAEDISLYFLLKTLANPFWVSMKEGIESAAAEAGVEVYVDAMNSEDELSGQLDKLLTAAGQDYDGIGIAPISPTNAIEGIVAANANGIPVVNLDEKVDGDELASAGGYLIGFVTTDNVAVGATGAGHIIANTEPGEVAIIEGKAGAASGEDRKKGAEEALTEAGYTIVASQPADWDRNKALDVATNILSQYPDLKAFYCANDTMALGVQEAVENAGLADKVLVVGTDGIPDAVKSVSEGRMAATVAQDPAQVGVVGFHMLLDAVKAGNAGAPDKEGEFKYVDSILITSENAAQFLE